MKANESILTEDKFKEAIEKNFNSFSLYLKENVLNFLEDLHFNKSYLLDLIKKFIKKYAKDN